MSAGNGGSNGGSADSDSDPSDLTKSSEYANISPIDGQNFEDAVLDVLDRIMALPRDVRMHLVAAVEAAARLEAAEASSQHSND